MCTARCGRRDVSDPIRRVALNAILLDASPTFRAAGISQYMQRTLRGLGQVAEAHWDFQAYVNRPGTPISGIGFHPVHRRLRSRWHRVGWEQTVLPLQLHRDKPHLFHGLVNVLPLYCPCPSVVTVMDLSFVKTPDTMPRIRRVYLNALCARSVDQADRVVAISQATADDLIRHYQVPGSRIDVIHVPVDPTLSPHREDYDPAMGDRLALPDRFLLHVGTLEPRKNLGWLLQAFADWPQQVVDRDVHLVLAGAAGWHDEHQRLLALAREAGLTHRIHFIGYVPPDAMGALYRAALACLFPSRHEGFGMPLLEAMACGTPVLCSDIAPFREIAQDCALYFPMDDASTLGAHLHALLTDSRVSRQLRHRGLAHVSRFTEEATGHALLDTYRRVL